MTTGRRRWLGCVPERPRRTLRRWSSVRSKEICVACGLVALLIADSRWLSRLPKLSTPTAGGQLVRFILTLFLSVLFAAARGSLRGALGLDPRGSLVSTYFQRNALVVGFVMGFAVIPIIYTIAEDALTAVPSALRSASLACGASRWQTATRVILPIAIPGIFSAIMVGLGRAAGETMIVLMAAGNTPVLEMNIFGGLRALSANITVELPAAVKDGTLYRVLFLAALTLFAMTFCINTVAELVRQRFRKRAVQL
ncbi:MAG: ABC transporter permease subunit [Acidobacteria bacterium]|nr:ABC transporter permease subunit [Acidobacteriota bacterium]